jgi:hypothetical protein|uniref:C2H2-type domain-containing protein n=1 Tax=viral metagenome TaxID=1070528 RepID=A0A6C0IN95_9ZZZZ
MSPKIPKKFNCIKCNYTTSNKKDYNKHISTLKHKNTTNTTEEIPIANMGYNCHCGKLYKHHSSLWNHKLKCPRKSPNVGYRDKSAEVTNNETIVALIQQNQEFKELLLEQNKHITNITTNNYTTTHNNQKFNLNFFLNTTCKDAMNMSDFIETIHVDFKDIENIGKNGYVTGMTDMILTRIKEMDVTKRPLHCTDLKRETMYIKDNDEWSKDTPDNSKLHRLMDCVAKQNYAIIPLWRENHPECQEWDHPQYEFCVSMMRNILGDVGSDQTRLDNKVIKNLSRHILVEKNTE